MNENLKMADLMASELKLYQMVVNMSENLKMVLAMVNERILKKLVVIIMHFMQIDHLGYGKKTLFNKLVELKHSL
jgi:hypothetical protein